MYTNIRQPVNLRVYSRQPALLGTIRHRSIPFQPFNLCLRPLHRWHKTLDFPQISIRLINRILPIIPLILDERLQHLVYLSQELVPAFLVRDLARDVLDSTLDGQMFESA